MAKYTIRLDTPKVKNAGTNADVEASILGTAGESAFRALDRPNYDDREQGTQDYYHLELDDQIGDILGLKLRVKKADEDNPNWLLGTAWICRVGEGRLYALPYNKWIEPTSSTTWTTVTLNTLQDLGQVALESPFLWGVPKPQLTAKYTIRLDTPQKPGAGTNADVEARILGTNSKTAWRVLDNPRDYDDREQGSKDFYRLYFEDSFGDITGLELRVKKADEDSPNWLLESASICKVAAKRLYALPFNKWINPKSYTAWDTAVLGNVQDKGTIKAPSPYLW